MKKLSIFLLLICTTIAFGQAASGPPAILIVKDPWFDVRAYGAVGDGATDDAATIVLANTAAAVAGGTVFFPTGTHEISSDTSFSAGVNVKLIGGTKLSVDSSKTVTIESPRNIIASPNQQIMSGSGLLRWTDRGGKVYAEWWGIDGTADATEINAAIQSFNEVNKGGIIQLLDKTYVLGAKIDIDIASTQLRGMGPGATILSQSAAATTVENSAVYVTLSDFMIAQNVGSQDAIYSTGHFTNINRIRIALPAAQNNNIGIHTFDGYQTRIYQCDISGDQSTLGTNTGNIGVKVEGASQNFSIRDCTIANIQGTYGIWAGKGSSDNIGGSLLIDGCDIENVVNGSNTSVGIGVGSIYGVWITHCHMEGINSGGSGSTAFWVSAGLESGTDTSGLEISNNYFQYDSGLGIKLDYVTGFRIKDNVFGGAAQAFARLTTTANTTVSTSADWMVTSPAGILELYNSPAAAQASATYVNVTDAPAVNAPASYGYAKLVVNFTADKSATYTFKYSDDSTPIEATVASGGAGTKQAVAEGVFDGPGTGLGKLQAKATDSATWIIQKAYLIFY